MRKTKIICTIGPACDKPEILREMALAGMNVARLNFSHGDHAYHKQLIEMVKEVRQELGLPIGILVDTKGPEIRLGAFCAPKVELKKGQTFTLTTAQVEGTCDLASITFDKLPQDVEPGTPILLDDGLIELKVTGVSNSEIRTKVISGGIISARKSVNVPSVDLSMPYISGKDRADLRFAVEMGCDFIAASFTRSASDILQLKAELERLRAPGIRVIAKIENAKGVSNIDEILTVCDGVMVARGDLGVEIPIEEIPPIQKKLIKKAYLAGKQVITATQMLESMVHSPRPTRAEVTDVANAIYDGTSAIMLSGETAAGEHPVEAVRTMARIARRAEQDIDYKKRFHMREEDHSGITNAISHATCAAAHDLSAVAIITVTKSGKTARMISKFRPATPIIGCAPDERVVRQMNLSWGVTPILVDEKESTDELFAEVIEAAEKKGLISEGEIVVITAGMPLGVSGTTNMMRIHVVGDPILNQ